MNLLVMAGLGLFLFALSLVINAIAGRVLGVALSRTIPSELPKSMWIVGVVQIAIIGSLGALWYFSSRPAGLGEGFVLGIVLVLVGIALDAAFILPLKNGRQILLGYLRQWQYWLTLTTLVLVCAGVGAMVSG